MDEEIIKMLKYIRLSGLLANWDHYLKIAQKGNLSHVRLLRYVIEEEYKIKKENSVVVEINCLLFSKDVFQLKIVNLSNNNSLCPNEMMGRAY
jgi:hypothetical protein